MSTNIGGIYRVYFDTPITLEPKARVVRKFIPAISMRLQIPFRVTSVVGINDADARKTLIEDIKLSNIWGTAHEFTHDVRNGIAAKVKEYNKASNWVEYQIRPGTRVDQFLGLNNSSECVDFFVSEMVNLELFPWSYYKGDVSFFIKNFDCMGMVSRNKMLTYAQDMTHVISSAHALERVLPMDCFEALIANRAVQDEEIAEVSDNGE